MSETRISTIPVITFGKLPTISVFSVFNNTKIIPHSVRAIIGI